MTRVVWLMSLSLLCKEWSSSFAGSSLCSNPCSIARQCSGRENMNRVVFEPMQCAHLPRNCKTRWASLCYVLLTPISSETTPDFSGSSQKINWSWFSGQGLAKLFYYTTDVAPVSVTSLVWHHTFRRRAVPAPLEKCATIFIVKSLLQTQFARSFEFALPRRKTLPKFWINHVQRTLRSGKNVMMKRSSENAIFLSNQHVRQPLTLCVC